MGIQRLLAKTGIHFLATKFGSPKLRSLAFDEKYRQGHWCFNSDGNGELSDVICKYLGRGDLLLMGCGGASILEGLESRGLTRAIGVDISTEAILIASRYASDKVEFKLQDMMKFKCLQSYDIILFSESLYYVHKSHQKSFLKSLAIYLKDEGVFIATFAEAKRFKNMIDGLRKDFSIIEDRAFNDSSRHLIVFTSH